MIVFFYKEICYFFPFQFNYLVAKKGKLRKESRVRIIRKYGKRISE
jgi:hypothetical protein